MFNIFKTKKDLSTTLDENQEAKADLQDTFDIPSVQDQHWKWVDRMFLQQQVLLQDFIADKIIRERIKWDSKTESSFKSSRTQIIKGLIDERFDAMTTDQLNILADIHIQKDTGIIEPDQLYDIVLSNLESRYQFTTDSQEAVPIGEPHFED